MFGFLLIYCLIIVIVVKLLVGNFAHLKFPNEHLFFLICSQTDAMYVKVAICFARSNIL